MTDEQNQRLIPDPKKQEAGRKGGLKRQDNWRRGVKECGWCGKLSADLNEHPCFIAAASMRSRCVEKVDQVRRNHGISKNQDYEYGFSDALNCVETALKGSPALDQVEQEKR